MFCGTGAYLLLECEQNEDARHHKLINKYFHDGTKQQEGKDCMSEQLEQW